MTWEALAGEDVSYAPSPLESARFGRTIGRLSVGWDADEREAAARVGRLMATVDESLVIARWPTHMFAVATAGEASRRAVLVADVLTYWEGRPETVLSHKGLAPVGVSVTPAGPAVEEALIVVEDVVRDSFQAYGNHYHANPALDQEAALAGYVEWAKSSLDRDGANMLLLLDGTRPIGLATLAQSGSGHDLEVELAGVRTSHQGQGLYTHLLSGCATEAQRRFCRRLLISTQVHNIRVQRTWARAGMVPFAAFTTAHASRR